MAAAEQDFLIEQGSTWTAGFTYKVAGVSQDLSGYVANCQIKKTASGEVIATPTCTIVKDEIGKIHLELTDEETWTIPATGRTYKDKTEYTLDITLTTPTGVTTRLINGIVSVSPGVTRNV